MAGVGPKKIIVLGAGVIGLTTAIKIQESGGYHVTIVADTLPSDPKTIKYTSHWAGAHHVSLAGSDMRQRQMDRETFETLWELSAPGNPAEKCFLRLPQEEYHCEERPRPDVLEIMPEYRELQQDTPAWPATAVHGAAFKTVTIDTPVYLTYLMSRFLAGGGAVVRGSVQHIAQLVESGAHAINPDEADPASPDAIVVCAGLGARALGGVEDKDVYPIRGQTVLLRAPWIRFGRTLSTVKGTWTYVIPRRSGDVIVGGTLGPDDWHPRPRPETTRDILQRVLALCPEIAPPDIRAVREPTIDDVLPIVIEEGCGLRPGRKGGIRLEVDDGGKVPIVHNYGHGGYGYISSWGSASIALGLLASALKKRDPVLSAKL
ncbi:putative FAD dependent oxidoreductase [Lyophyllum shimeji]|uniref:FAD dependent oxidoreductase n=1 Tax=Lyophyllum shimeji TaxID=47721 RepID=A0A9P3PNF2_LYOSH|nr:putative FAD dependent oxidoreductase [Lyophyllum shimeji]